MVDMLGVLTLVILLISRNKNCYYAVWFIHDCSFPDFGEDREGNTAVASQPHFSLVQVKKTCLNQLQILVQLLSAVIYNGAEVSSGDKCFSKEQSEQEWPLRERCRIFLGLRQWCVSLSICKANGTSILSLDGLLKTLCSRKCGGGVSYFRKTQKRVPFSILPLEVRTQQLAEYSRKQSILGAGV